ncbi:hypothetical protein [Aeromicrobium sp. Leaf291]|uniref:hypothetical protein n=1 Tax=Aeromicrobium sp. Leaf291 TaxID=1736325 RepID=UPI0006F99BF0|nr:hypothetical protein [Aeromicrobium sp. Leaf291]KQP82149.1 hypothetical protein ASF35_11930 [Aeromicrobium sp. Leaf291]
MNRPIKIQLPTSFGMGELIAAQSTVLAALGWDLGMKYDAYMRPRHGGHWLEDLRQKRWEETHQSLYKFKLTLVDPSFVITEPLKNSGSPLRACLPTNVGFYDLLETAWKIRNSAQHFDPPMTAELLHGRTKTLGNLAHQAGLSVAEDCKALLARLNAIGQGKVVHPGQLLSELRSRLDAEKEAAKDLAVQVAELRKSLSEAESTSKESDEEALRGELERLRAAVVVAEAEKVLAAENVTATSMALQVTSATLRDESDEEVQGLEPGDDWPAPPGSRILRLMPHVGDLYDPASEELLSDSVGRASIDAVVLWRQFIPHGGVVHLNEAGQACSLVGAKYVYLGSLDDLGREVAG